MRKRMEVEWKVFYCLQFMVRRREFFASFILYLRYNECTPKFPSVRICCISFCLLICAHTHFRQVCAILLSIHSKENQFRNNYLKEKRCEHKGLGSREIVLYTSLVCYTRVFSIRYIYSFFARLKGNLKRESYS